MSKFLDEFNSISSTNLRISITLLCVLITTIAYVITNQPPAGEWLMFLGGMSGIDMTQFVFKRKTTFESKIAPTTEEPESIQSTDIQELSSQKG